MEHKSYRMTRQKKVILEELRKVKSHPTAAEIHGMVKKIVPNISLGTVYRNLELLFAQGEILKLDFAGKKSRFDGNSARHCHLHCTECGKVYDLNENENREVLDKICLQKLRERCSFEIFDYKIEIIGRCFDCKKMELGS